MMKVMFSGMQGVGGGGGMAYSVYHAPLKSYVKCFLKFIQWKSTFFSNL